jgi:hypothetical protein
MGSALDALQQQHGLALQAAVAVLIFAAVQALFVWMDDQKMGGGARWGANQRSLG